MAFKTIILFVSYFYINSSKDEVSNNSIGEQSDEMNKEYTEINSLDDISKEEIESFVPTCPPSITPALPILPPPLFEGGRMGGRMGVTGGG